MPPGLIGSGEQVAFVSCVHDDNKLVDERQRELEAAGRAVRESGDDKPDSVDGIALSSRTFERDTHQTLRGHPGYEAVQTIHGGEHDPHDRIGVLGRPYTVLSGLDPNFDIVTL